MPYVSPELRLVKSNSIQLKTFQYTTATHVYKKTYSTNKNVPRYTVMLTTVRIVTMCSVVMLGSRQKSNVLMKQQTKKKNRYNQ